MSTDYDDAIAANLAELIEVQQDCNEYRARVEELEAEVKTAWLLVRGIEDRDKDARAALRDLVEKIHAYRIARTNSFNTDIQYLEMVDSEATARAVIDGASDKPEGKGKGKTYIEDMERYK